MQTLILDAAGRELVKRVIKLCGSAKHFARGKYVDLLLDSAVEAGRLTAEIPELNSPAERRDKALKALDALNKTIFLLQVAEGAEYFPVRKIKNAFDLAEEMNKSLQFYAYGKKVAEEKSAPPADIDGFNDDYIV